MILWPRHVGASPDWSVGDIADICGHTTLRTVSEWLSVLGAGLGADAQSNT